VEIAKMGRVVTEALIENIGDLINARNGLILPDQVRRVTVTDASVNTGATTLALPTRLIHQLGLTKRYEKRSRSSLGIRMASVYDAVRVTIQGRDATVDVVEVPDEIPVLIGQIPLEMMDFVVDLQQRRLVGNPAHGGEQMIEMY
jgi:predicted aspartyl protease